VSRDDLLDAIQRIVYSEGDPADATRKIRDLFSDRDHYVASVVLGDRDQR
jgi:hypothetical protein